jgi:hypothetical protein
LKVRSALLLRSNNAHRSAHAISQSHCAGMSASKKQKAGKASGARRLNLAKRRQLAVLSAYERLNQPYRDQPFSKYSLDDLEKELDRSEQQRSLLKALAQNLEPPLSEYESAVEIIEDPIAHILGKKRRSARRKVHSEKHDALLDDVVRGLLDYKKDKRKTAVPNDRSRDTLINDLKALGIKSKRGKKRSG